MCIRDRVIDALRGVRVVAIAAGFFHSMVLTDEGVVLSFGAELCGHLGHGDGAGYCEPKVIEALSGVRVAAIAAGDLHSLVLTDKGAVLSFGSGEGLGHGDEHDGDAEDQYVPKVIEALRDTHVVAIAAGSRHSMVLTDKGEVLSFGNGRYGQLGHDDQAAQREPTPMLALHGTRVVAIAVGGWQSMVLTDEGKVLSFGDGRLGQIGHGDREDQLMPKVIEEPVSYTHLTLPTILLV